MMMMKEYPTDVMPLYSQGHSVAHYLIGRRGKQAFLAFLEDGMQDEDWPRAVREHYGYQNLLAMQNNWLAWIKQGRPEVQPDRDSAVVLASAESDHRPTDNIAPDATPNWPVTVASLPQRPAPNLIYREELTNRPAPARQGATATDDIGPQERESRGVILEWTRPARH